MNLYGNLMRFCQEGVEAVNLDLKISFLKHSQKGGAKGNCKKKKKGWRKNGDQAEGVVNWVCRRFCWISGIAEAHFNDQCSWLNNLVFNEDKERDDSGHGSSIVDLTSYDGDEDYDYVS